MYACETIEKGYATARTEYEKMEKGGEVHIARQKPEELYSSANEFIKALINCKVIETGNTHFFSQVEKLDLHGDVQPTFNKQFDLLKQSLYDYWSRGYKLIISVSSEQQIKRVSKRFIVFIVPLF